LACSIAQALDKGFDAHFSARATLVPPGWNRHVYVKPFPAGLQQPPSPTHEIGNTVDVFTCCLRERLQSGRTAGIPHQVMVEDDDLDAFDHAQRILPGG
jgi:hypothetical protein